MSIEPARSMEELVMRDRAEVDQFRRTWFRLAFGLPMIAVLLLICAGAYVVWHFGS